MLDSAISGHTGVPPMLWIICMSIASVVWCTPVITSGAYRKPNSAAPTGAKLPVITAFTAQATPSPIMRPNGPISACARNTASSSETTGTTTR